MKTWRAASHKDKVSGCLDCVLHIPRWGHSQGTFRSRELLRMPADEHSVVALSTVASPRDSLEEWYEIVVAPPYKRRGVWLGQPTTPHQRRVLPQGHEKAVLNKGLCTLFTQLHQASSLVLGRMLSKHRCYLGDTAGWIQIPQWREYRNKVNHMDFSVSQCLEYYT